MTVYYPRRLVHLGINIVGDAAKRGVALPVNQSEIHKKVESYLAVNADDWYRYAGQNYVLWTNRSVADLAIELCNVPGLEHLYVFATEFVHSGANGMMPKPFWDWLNKPRST